MLIAYRARDIAEAHIVSGMLNARGIESHVGGHYLQGAMGEIGAAGFTNVHVQDEDYPLARDLVAEYEASRPEEASVSASSGSRVERYAIGFLLAVAVLVAVLVGAI
jgi:putative signal transducing protein